MNNCLRHLPTPYDYCTLEGAIKEVPRSVPSDLDSPPLGVFTHSQTGRVIFIENKQPKEKVKMMPGQFKTLTDISLLNLEKATVLIVEHTGSKSLVIPGVFLFDPISFQKYGGPGPWKTISTSIEDFRNRLNRWWENDPSAWRES